MNRKITAYSLSFQLVKSNFSHKKIGCVLLDILEVVVNISYKMLFLAFNSPHV